MKSLCAGVAVFVVIWLIDLCFPSVDLGLIGRGAIGGVAGWLVFAAFRRFA